MAAAPNTFEFYGESKRLRTDPGYFVSEQRGRLSGPSVNIHTLKWPTTMAKFDDLTLDPNPSTHSILVECSWSEWMPELRGTLRRHRRGHVDASDWVRGEDQDVCGMMLPAVLTDWLLDVIDGARRKDYGDREPPCDIHNTILVDAVSTESVSVAHSALCTVYTERDSPYD